MARRTATRALAEPTGPVTITIPHLYAPRSYQRPVLEAWERGFRRICLVWHRKAGKDLTCAAVATKAMVRRPGLIWYIFPKLNLGRKAFWDAQDSSPQGIPFRDRFPRSLVASVNDTEMQITFKALPGQASGSIFQVVGADDPDSLRGPNPVGVILSEYSEHDPTVLTSIVTPILRANGGWLIVNGTPMGENHFHTLYEMAKRDPEWWADLKTIADTHRDATGEDGRWVVTPEEVAAERRQGLMTEEEIQREFYCSFKGSVRGSILGDLVTLAEQEGRVGFFPHDPALPVGTAWDIGRGTTVVWCWQEHGNAIDCIDCIEVQGKDLAFVAHVLKEERAYLYGEHLFPHDMAVKEWTATKSRLQSAEQDYRLRPAYVAEKQDVEDSYEGLRRFFRRFRFHQATCGVTDVTQHRHDGLNALRNVKREWNEKRKDFTGAPLKDWASHTADALRTFVGAYRSGRMGVPDEIGDRPRYAQTLADALAPLSGRRYARHEKGGWG